MSTTETGHAKNVANLGKFSSQLNTLGATYNPSSALLTAQAFVTLYTTAGAKLQAVKVAEDFWKTETNKREIAFANTFIYHLLLADIYI